MRRIASSVEHSTEPVEYTTEGRHLISTPNLIHKLYRAQQFYSAKKRVMFHSSRLKLVFDWAYVKFDV